VSYRQASNFTGAGFWSQMETARFLCQNPAGTTFSAWLTDLFTFGASTVWDFFEFEVQRILGILEAIK